MCCFPVKPKSTGTSYLSLDSDLETIAFAHDSLEAMRRENSDIRSMMRNIQNHLIKTIAKNRGLEARIAELEWAMKIQDLCAETGGQDTGFNMSKQDLDYKDSEQKEDVKNLF